jgi:hypothetical protein
MVERTVAQSLDDDDPRKVLETFVIIVRKCLYDCATTRQAMSSDASGPDRPSASGPRRARVDGLDNRRGWASGAWGIRLGRRGHGGPQLGGALSKSAQDEVIIGRVKRYFYRAGRNP